jgi:hypothetical protein
MEAQTQFRLCEVQSSLSKGLGIWAQASWAGFGKCTDFGECTAVSGRLQLDALTWENQTFFRDNQYHF